MPPRKRPEDMTDQEFERWLRRNHITGMLAVTAATRRRLVIAERRREAK